VVADFFHAEPGALGRLVGLFEERVQPSLVEQGHDILGHFVAELTPNDYPRLPVVQDPTLLVVLSAYRDPEHCAALRQSWSVRGPTARGGLASLLTGGVATSYLRPTARSLTRYRGRGAQEQGP
jgi:hypothetical protein